MKTVTSATRLWEQPASSGILSSEVRIGSLDTPRGICDGQSGTGTGVFLCVTQPTLRIHSHSSYDPDTERHQINQTRETRRQRKYKYIGKKKWKDKEIKQTKMEWRKKRYEQNRKIIKEIDEAERK
jgi:hypothetical protein